MTEYGPVVPWEGISRGFNHGGRHYHLANRARGIFRPVGMVGGALSVKTTVPRAGRNPPRYADLADADAGYFVYRFQGDDPDARDNRLLVACHQLDAPLIYLFGVEEGLYEPLWPVYISRLEPETLSCRVTLDEQAAVARDGSMVLRDPLMTQVKRRYLTVQAKRRLHQDAFREVVLRAYEHRCAVCGLPRLKLLVEAAHIVPDRDEQGRPVVQNGLAMCSLHHSAFDAHLLGLRPDLTIEIAPRLLAERDGPVLQHAIKDLNHRAIRVPSRRADRPGDEYVAARWETFLKAMG